MADAGKRLVGPQYLGTASATLYTAPAATTTFVRNIHITNTSGSQQTFSMAINATASTAANQVFTTYSVPANGVADFSGYWVLGAGDYLAGLCSTASTLTVYISGVESS